jgi:integrase
MTYHISTRHTKTHGLAFDLYYRWQGEKHRPLLGYNLSPHEAERLAINMIAKIQKGAQAAQDVSSITLADVLPLFWESFRIKGRIDEKRPRGIIENHLLSCNKCQERDRVCPHRFGEKPIYALTAEDGLRYVTERLNEGASPGTVRREYQVLVRILNLAVRYDKLDRNRLKGVELPDAPKRTRVAEPEELQAISTIREQDHVKRECLEELWRIVVVAVNTGLREAKVVAIERSWIKKREDGYWLSLPPAASRIKGNPVELPLNRPALAALHEVLPSVTNPRVFRHWKDIRAFKKYWDATCTRAGIQNLHFHDLRHTFGTRLQRLGVDYEVRQALLGHKMPGMTADYSHGGPEWDQKLRDAVTRLEKAHPLSYELSYRPTPALAGLAEAID